MAQQAHRETDERLNELSDKDAVWGPLLAFRPEKNRCIGGARVLAMASILGGFYGIVLDVALLLVYRHSSQHCPPAYVMPAILTLTYFAAFQLTLGPAWNRRARLMARREGYLQSLDRTRHSS